MGKMSKAKGYRGEHEVEGIFRKHGIDARRGRVEFREPDIVTDTPLHVEVKRCENITFPKWWKQSKEATKEGEITTLVFRRSNEKWIIAMELEDFLKLWKGEK